MTPSNPPITPEIENIADNQGNKHTVIPSNHTHAQSEVAGLENFINTRSHKIDKSQGNTYAYVNAQSDANTGQAKIVVGIENFEETEYSRTIDVTWASIKNLERALLTPDTTPTADSDNLVTSGGVAAALASKMDNKTIDSTPTANSTNLVTSGGVKAALDTKANTTQVNNALADKAPLADTSVVYGTLEDEDGVIKAIDVDDLFQGGNTQVTLLIENKAGTDVKIEDAFTSDDQTFAFLTDMVDFPDKTIIACRILVSTDTSLSAKYFVVIDGMVYTTV